MQNIYFPYRMQMEGYAVLVEEAGFDTEAEKMAENHLILWMQKNLRKIMRFHLRLPLTQNIWGSDLEMKNFWRRIRKHGSITISGIKKREPVHCTGYSYEKDCVWKVKCFTIFWEEPCLLVKQAT